jgi:hypothetical protein
LSGGIVYLIACAKNGVFTQKGRTLRVKENFIYSIIVAGIASLFLKQYNIPTYKESCDNVLQIEKISF